ncbi:DUF559 domain-containing protein [Mycobacterium sp. M1]|uniref:DUF559 domain-containing protein n=1 Tax=Mycolicibacter acidiphilus TaxID=2835306 RepID=A0ABS5RQ55_9MYCO|nr:DUF559 domain-containing protein [Mycolicibacter acidiphilus]MBS9535656.1 DUF559 domain-containing protein [Mycolicibacter acidiphilus]
MAGQPFIGSEALAAGKVSWDGLTRYHTALMPNVYLGRGVTPSLAQRTVAGWLWSGRQAVVAGAAASALHGAKWVDDDALIELIWGNARAPAGVKTRADLLLPGETQLIAGVPVTSVERTAFDLGRRGSIDSAVARLDALANATHFKVDDVLALAAKHRHTRGLRQLDVALTLVDAGAQSPQETRVRLLLINSGFQRPQTQIPVLGPDGLPRYFLDMGWEDLMLAVEYDGDQHRTSRQQFAWDVERLEYIKSVGWTHIRVLKEHRDADIVRRVCRAWADCTRPHK